MEPLDECLCCHHFGIWNRVWHASRGLDCESKQNKMYILCSMTRKRLSHKLLAVFTEPGVITPGYNECRYNQVCHTTTEVQLNHENGKKWEVDLSNFECSMRNHARVGLVLQRLLVCWDFPTQPPSVFTKNSLKKQKYIQWAAVYKLKFGDSYLSCSFEKGVYIHSNDEVSPLKA